MFVKVGKAADLKPGQGKSFQVEGKNIAVFNVKGKFFAVDDCCSHMGAPLVHGMLAGDSITCEWHGAEFDLQSGRALCGPARGDIGAYTVQISSDDDIEIDL